MTNVSAQHSSESRHASAARTGPNDIYLGHRLTYREVESQLDDEVGMKELLQVLVIPVLVALIVFLLFFSIGVVQAVQSLGESAFGMTEESSGGGGWIFFGFLLALVAFAGLLRAMRADVGISEWSFLVEDQAGAARTAYEHIVDVLKRRQIPADTSTHQAQGARDVTGHFLVISSGADAGFVAVYPYGTGLYLGWMLWRPQNGWDVVATFLRQIFAPRARMDRLLTASPTRALREAVHSATREGVDIAAQAGSSGRAGRERQLPDAAAGSAPTSAAPACNGTGTSATRPQEPAFGMPIDLARDPRSGT